MSDIIYLNVNGKHYSCRKKILNGSFLFELLCNKLEELEELEELGIGTKTNRIFIDRDDDLFEDFLGYLINASYSRLSGVHISEFEYYGIGAFDEDIDNIIKEKVITQAESILNNKSIFHVSACGKMFYTSKKTLKKSRYFSSLLRDLKTRLSIKSDSSKQPIGTMCNPLSIDVPPSHFKKFLSFLRNEKIGLPSDLRYLMDYFGEDEICYSKEDSDDNIITDIKTLDIPYSRQIPIGFGMQFSVNKYNHSSRKCIFSEDLRNQVIPFYKSDRMVFPKDSNNRVCKWESRTIEFEINRGMCDYLGNCYLMFNIIGDNLKNIKWKKNLRYRIIREISFSFRDMQFKDDSMSGWMLYCEELMYEETPLFECEPNVLVVPLRFAWNLHKQKFLPIFHLAYNMLSLYLELSDIRECVERVEDNGCDLDEVKIECALLTREIAISEDVKRYYLNQVSGTTILSTRNILLQCKELSLIESNRKRFEFLISDLNHDTLINNIFFTLHDDDDIFNCVNNKLVSAELLYDSITIWSHNEPYLRTIDKKNNDLIIPPSTNMIYSYSFDITSRSADLSGCFRMGKSGNDYEYKLIIYTHPSIKKVYAWVKTECVLLFKDGMVASI